MKNALSFLGNYDILSVGIGLVYFSAARTLTTAYLKGRVNMHRTKRNFVPFILTIAAIVGILMTTAFAEGEAEYVSNFFSTPLSLLPPVLAIALALITKEVYTSLFLGCLVGGFLYANFNPVMGVTSTFDTPMLEITNQNVKAVYYYEDQEEVAKTFSKYGYILMPVIDEQHHLLGVIDIDDVMDVIEEETTEDMNLLGGVGSEERLDSTLVESFKNRIPWLIVNLFTAIMASSVVSVFEGTIAKVVALATISPIITGMGGNAGTQTLTIVVRGLSLGELDKENARKVLLKEIGLGILNGVIIGALVSVGAWFFAGNPWFGVVAGLAMICNMIVATLAGYFVPVILDRFHVDPALASGVFVTTCTDMFGFFAFLGLATILMSHLL